MFEAPAKDGCGDGCLSAALVALAGVVMCIPKRTPAQQARHEATMRAINRGRRNHPRHHNLSPIYVLACAAGVVFAAAVMYTAAWFTEPTPASPPATGTSTGTRP